MSEATISIEDEIAVIRFPFSQRRDVTFERDILGAIRVVSSTEALEDMAAYFDEAIAERKSERKPSIVDRVIADQGGEVVSESTRGEPT